jgi:D-alanine-D-alanine ligase
MKRGKAVILYGKVDPDAALDEQDTLLQAETVHHILERQQWDSVRLPVTLDLAAAAAELERLSPRFVFNLVETLQGKGRLIAVIPSLLDGLRIPFTGAPTDAVFLTSNKLLSKSILCRAGISTLPWLPASRLLNGEVPFFGPPYIVKDAWEHASIGIDDASIAAGFSALLAQVKRRAGHGKISDSYVEPFIEGREFNLSLLGGTGEPENPLSLPPAEIDFLGYPEGKPRVVGYNAKWVEDSFEYSNTPRRFDFPPSDAPILKEMIRISRECWRLFGLRGYARVDFRLNSEGTPFVLEINTNPCIAPESGFAAAAEMAGLDLDAVVDRIVHEALGKGCS